MSDDLRFDALLTEGADALPPPADVSPWRSAMSCVVWGIALKTLTLQLLYLHYILPTLGCILLVLGFSILRSPVSLEKQTMRLIGILLIMQAVRGYTDPFAAHDQVTSTLLTIAGAVLLLMPLAVSRFVVVLCGIVVLLIGIGNVLDLAKGRTHPTGNDDDIIDAR